MKYIRSLFSLKKYELLLWICSVLVVTASSVFGGSQDIRAWIASLIGVTALIYVAKGYVVGQILTVVFAVLYGFISFKQQYYGEMITYLGMTSPIAILATIEWIRHPFQQTEEVEVGKPTPRQLAVMFSLAVVVTVAFYFILQRLNNASLWFSTLSVTTSFLASYLTFLRSPYYGLAYASNDVILIVLWVIASLSDKSSVPMVACFAMFLVNDLYGFINWKRMQKRQRITIH